MLSFYLEGGFFMHPIALTGILGLVLGLVQILLARKVNLGPALVGVAIWTLLLGLLGTVVGLIRTFEAVATAPVELKTAMLTTAAAVSLTTTIFASIWVLLHVLVGSVAATVRANVARSQIKDRPLVGP